MMVLTAIVVYLIVVILLKLWSARHHNEENHYVADENEISEEKFAENDLKLLKRSHLQRSHLLMLKKNHKLYLLTL